MKSLEIRMQINRKKRLMKVWNEKELRNKMLLNFRNFLKVAFIFYTKFFSQGVTG